MTRSPSRGLASPPGGSSSGFTLVELLLALGISAVLFTSMFWGLDQIVRSRNNLSNRATPYTIGPAILDRIASDLANVYWYEFRDNNSFFGQKASLIGRDADAMSFITLSKGIAPEQSLKGPDPEYPGRYSWTNEVAYVCKTGAPGFLELWRREDFYVDDAPHSDGDYVLLYDRVHSLTLRYIGRTPANSEGGPPARPDDGSEYIRESWDPVKEEGIPRAVLVILSIASQDQFSDFQTPRDKQRIYTFQRYLPLPQVHMSAATQQQIATWDGTLNEAAPVVARNPQGQPQQGTVGGAGGRTQQQQRQPGQGQGGGGRAGGGARPAPGANPFMQALQGAGARPSGGAGAGIPGGLGALFGGGRR